MTFNYRNSQDGRFHTPNSNTNQQTRPPQQPQPQSQRWNKRAGQSAMDTLYDAGPYIVAIVSFVIAIASLIALQAVDIIAGRFTDGYFTTMDYGWYYSLATTGIVLATTGTAMYAWRERWNPILIGALVLIALVPIGIDCYFDSLSVDVIKYGHFINPAIQFANDPATIIPYRLFRIMVAFLSAIGEPLAAASVILFPVIKELIKGVIS